MGRTTMAQALVDCLIAEGVEVVFGILGHGCVQMGQALYERRESIRYIGVKNEQGAVHAAVAYARLTGKPLAVITSVGPGATNLVTGAAMAHVNRLPVLLLPGEVFAEGVGPVLQQVESWNDTTANDTLRPVSRYWSRINKPQRIKRAVREAFDAMLFPGHEGPATLCLPMDVQAEAMDMDMELLLSPSDRRQLRPRPDRGAIALAAKLLAQAKRPFAIAGGGVLRSQAQGALMALAEHLSMPVAPTQAGKGAVLFDHPLNAFAVGPTGTAMGNNLAKKADLILGVGTRYSDFTTSSETAFAQAGTFININIAPFDVGKERAWKLWGDARVTLDALLEALKEMGVARRGQSAYAEEIAQERQAWVAETDLWRAKAGLPLRQSRAIGLINDRLPPLSVVISAAGSLPGELQKLWRDKDPEGLGYLCEYGYSTMGFEVPAGLGARLACPDRRVVVLVGDMSFLMMPQELVTAAQYGLAYTVVVFDNHGGQSIRHLQMNQGFTDQSMEIRHHGHGEILAVDYAEMAKAMGCVGLRARDEGELLSGLDMAQEVKDRPTVIHLEVDRNDLMPGYGAWWDVPQPTVDMMGRPRPARADYEAQKAKQRVL